MFGFGPFQLMILATVLAGVVLFMLVGLLILNIVDKERG